MDLHESTEVAAPLKSAWPALHDVRLVASCLPGAQLTGEVDEDGEYPGRLDIRFGPTRASFAGRARLDFDDAEKIVSIRGQGQDPRGRSRASVAMVVQAEAVGSDRTRLRIDGSITVVGPLERFASTGGVHLARELMHSFAGNLAHHIERTGTTPSESVSGSGHATPAVSGGQGPLRFGILLLRALRRWVRGRRT